jgi:hypothetical protein
MMLINGLMAEWKKKTTAQKIKMILHGIAMIGGGAIGSTIGDKCSEGKKPVSAFCAKVTGGFLGGIAADAAMKRMDDSVDSIEELIRERKEGKANA